MKLNNIDFQFKSWFTGFFEGDGCFNINRKTNRCFLMINQKNPQVLIYIKNTLKRGSIKKYDNYYRWTVSSKKDMYDIIQIFNGYLILDKTNIKLQEWIQSYNTYYKLKKSDFYYITYKNKGSWNSHNSWQSGFIDAEGCFNIRIVNKLAKQKELLSKVQKQPNIDLINKNLKSWKKYILSPELLSPISLRVRLRFVVRQKSEKKILDKLKELYTGSVGNKQDIFTYTLDSNRRQLKIINYILKHPLKSIKHKDFLKWKNMYNLLEKKDHLKIKNVTKVINYLLKHNN